MIRIYSMVCGLTFLKADEMARRMANENKNGTFSCQNDKK